MRGLYRREVVRCVRSVVAAVAALALQAACDDAPAKSDFIARANDLCTEVERDLDAVDDELYSARSLDEVGHAVDRATRTYEDFRSDVNELQVPEEDRATLDRWLDAVDRTLDALHRLDDAVDAGDAEGVRAIAQQGAELEREAARYARDYGLDECASRDV